MTALPDLTRLTDRLRRREITSEELIEMSIARSVDAPGAVVSPQFAAARTAARAADAEIASDLWRGPLHGIPIGVKDAIDVAGLTTTLCSPLCSRSAAAPVDAAVWARLHRAGAILIGKLHCAELCLGAPGEDDAYPWPRHPADPMRSPGGSSSGSAVAVAQGIVAGALGTDTAGSIRLPAAYCGLAGLKPTDGLLPTNGVAPLAPSLDQVGPMARSARDCALLLSVLTGGGGGQAPPLPERLDGMRLGTAPEILAQTGLSDDHRSCIAGTADLAASLGATLRDVSLPPLERFTECALTLMLAEAFALYGAQIRTLDTVSYITRTRIEAGAPLSREDYQRAIDDRVTLAGETVRAMEGLDAVLLPAATGDPPQVSAIGALDYMRAPMVTALANVAGLPALTIRCGTSAKGFAVGLQIVGPPGADATVLRIGHAIEQALGTLQGE